MPRTRPHAAILPVPNKGIEKELIKRVRAIRRKIIRSAIAELKKGYESKVAAAAKAKDKAKASDAAVATAADADPTAPATKKEVELASDLARVMIQAGFLAKSVSRWYTRQLLRTIPKAQWRAMRRAGVSTAFMRKRWSKPYIKGQYIAPSTYDKIPDFVKWSTELITKMCHSSCIKVQNEFAKAIEQGYDYGRLNQTLLGLENMDVDRAALVALDQSNKLNQFIQHENCKAIGVEYGIWVHMPGKYTHRHSHKEMDGKRYKLDEGMYDPEVDRNVFPAELPYCRCTFRAVLPSEVLEEK